MVMLKKTAFTINYDNMHRFGDLVLVSFPFTDASGIKKRPALVLLDFEDGDVLATRVSTQSNGSEFDVDIADWQASGLLAPSFARLHKMATLSSSLIEKKLGTLSRQDAPKIKYKLQQLVETIIK
ncbi:MAG: type II toxin-antitoxin system PemK/MazF family toxin [Saprospiraceae bacterium]|nr:MAG: type II toxin-antitoxin system PemK/MazF family toxin [Saprospiraceae bacterium]